MDAVGLGIFLAGILIGIVGLIVMGFGFQNNARERAVKLEAAESRMAEAEARLQSESYRGLNYDWRVA